MRFTVTWTPTAIQKLADLWTTASDRADVTSAANAIDDALRLDPFSQSESRFGADRVMIVPPLSVYFNVSAEDHLVTVRTVWRRGG